MRVLRFLPCLEEPHCSASSLVMGALGGHGPSLRSGVGEQALLLRQGHSFTLSLPFYSPYPTPRGASPLEPWFLSRDPPGLPLTAGTQLRRVGRHQLVLDENVRGVITMNEEYETRFLCNTSKVHNWSPEEAIEAIAKIRSHISIRPSQLEILKEFHKEIAARAAKN
ncbi:phosphatidylglycerophosphatase and protein-tyrosine phosphatase 1 isoform X3 [Rattus norvegicus]|uniref:phosphatidylglycerophosphatase and protein-tyrosine phosphatase 1 isoform X3 n=1 Tax=Rattus norvegicus TaxID=10116 RepID=UPI001916D092|nr:phosphatidylglycerophosphatase and protein-tyrosine phosphatase 1 isoform X2 [Rattus norvegicus]